MITITINEDLPLKQKAFGNVTEFFAALEEHGLFVVLREFSEEDLTEDVKMKAKKTREEFRSDPAEFSDI